MSEDITLISFNMCPFVQRAAIALQEQGREYEIQYIDLRNKPDWFLELSPLGKVPLLKVGDSVLFESSVILNYLDETTSGERLLPEDPIERATQRMWMEFISGIMSTGWQLQAAKSEEKARELTADVRGRLERLVGVMSEEGPYWAGEKLTMVDVAIAPILQRFTWADTLEPSLGILEGLPRIQAWRDALLARESLPKSVLPDLETIHAAGLESIGSWVARNHA